MQRHEEIYQRVVGKDLDLVRAGLVWGQNRCPVCGLAVSVRKRTDAVYCSPKCRTKAWRQRRAATPGGS
ncbi:hypothetical protein [Streptomyces sp. MMBL 11-3]|uniref:hypothetical protein n=1 Tax=Streptomyces sp. MMBL 11-3 TaxID=3382639 RepID=UPI0039B4F510